MRFYLETNSLRQLANKLLDKNFCNNCFTSILSIAELLSGINEKEFFLRKSIFQKLNQSGVIVNHEFPEFLRLQAFGIYKSFKTSNDIIEISNILIESDSYFEFQFKLAKLDLITCWHFLKKYDQNGNAEFKNAFKQRVSGDINITKDSIKDFKERWRNINVSNKHLYIDEAIFYYAMETLKYDNSKSIQELLISYNHSLDIFFLSTFYYSEEKKSHKDETGNNDYFDLTHLSYLSDENHVIVTDDKIIHRIMENTLYTKNISYVNVF